MKLLCNILLIEQHFRSVLWALPLLGMAAGDGLGDCLCQPIPGFTDATTIFNTFYWADFDDCPPSGDITLKLEPCGGWRVMSGTGYPVDVTQGGVLSIGQLVSCAGWTNIVDGLLYAIQRDSISRYCVTSNTRMDLCSGYPSQCGNNAWLELSNT